MYQYSSSSVEIFPTIVTSTNTSTTTTISFNALNPYQKYWSIQGRESTKKTLKTYNNVCGSRKVFGFDLVDHDKDEIHLSAFVELVESLYGLIQVGKLYIILNGPFKEYVGSL